MDIWLMLGRFFTELFFIAAILCFYQVDCIINIQQKFVTILFMVSLLGGLFLSYCFGELMMEVILFMLTGLMGYYRIFKGKKSKDISIITVPGGEYEAITFDGSANSNMHLQSQIRYAGNTYMVAGGIPDKNSDIKVYAQETEKENVYMATVKVKQKLSEMSLKQRFITLHNCTTVISILLIPILFGSNVGKTFRLGDSVLVFGLFGYVAYLLRDVDALYYRMLYYFAGFTEMVVWIGLILRIFTL